MQHPATPDRARAYIAAPVSVDDALEAALRWASRRGAAGRWDAIAVLVSEAVAEEQPLRLRRLRVQGVSVEVVTGDAALPGHTGPVVLYCPDHPTLAAVENLPRRCAIVALGADAGCLRPWVDAFAPHHLGGQMLEVTDPLLPDATVRRAMVYFTHRITSTPGAGQEPQLENVLGGLRELRGQGHRFTADELMALALQLNWPGRTAGQLHALICEAFAEPIS